MLTREVLDVYQHLLNNGGNSNTPHMVTCRDMGGGGGGEQRDEGALSPSTHTIPFPPLLIPPPPYLILFFLLPSVISCMQHGEVIIKRTILLGMQLELYTIVVNHYNSRHSSSCI